ncbi:MAG: hypothetical protein QOD39_3441 [Mycobacterium sp.]|nr:hypothetical protein [Mycobacterium sp.]
MKDEISAYKDHIVLGVITALIGAVGILFVVQYNSPQSEFNRCLAGAVENAADAGVPVDLFLVSTNQCGESPG